MLIRPGRQADSRKCAEIHMEARAAMSYLPDLHTPAQVVLWMQDVVFANESVIVAEIDGAVVGYASYSGKFLSNLYVMPGMQRQGVGSSLLDSVFRQMPTDVAVRVFEANIAAIRFYERHGFRTISRSSGDNQEGLPDRLMKKCLVFPDR